MGGGYNHERVSWVRGFSWLAFLALRARKRLNDELETSHGFDYAVLSITDVIFS